MFKHRTTTLTFIFIFFISSNLYAVDEFDLNLLSDRINRLEKEITDIQKSLFSSDDNS